MDEEECPICFHMFSESVRCIADCGHYVCLSCNLHFEKHKRYLCPLCRHPISNIKYSGGNKLYVANLYGQIIPIEINLKHTTIKQILEIINIKFNHPIYQLIPTYQGRPLNPNKTCFFYNIPEHGTIYIIKKLSAV